MDCKQTQTLLSEYVDHQLDDNTQKRVAEHISVCENCEKELAVLQSMVEKLGKVPRVSAPDDFLFQLNKRLYQESGFKRFLSILNFPFRMKPSFQFATATAVAVLIVFAVNLRLPESPLYTASKKKVTPVEVDSISIKAPSPTSVMEFEEPAMEQKLLRSKDVTTSVPEMPGMDVGNTAERASKTPQPIEWTIRIKSTPREPEESELIESRQRGLAMSVKRDSKEHKDEAREQMAAENIPDPDALVFLETAGKDMAAVSEEKEPDLKIDIDGMDHWARIIQTTAEKFDGKVLHTEKTDSEDKTLEQTARLIVVELPRKNQKVFYNELAALNHFHMPEEGMMKEFGETSLIRIKLLP